MMDHKQDSFVTPVRDPPRKRSRQLTSSSITSSPSLLQIPPSPMMSKLGCGTGVSVYLLPRSPAPGGAIRSPWAVKKINRKLTTTYLPMFEGRLKDEAGVLKNLKHPNIVGYRTVSRSQDGSLCLCMESGERSLFDIIEERLDLGEGPFDAKYILKVAHEVGKGLHFLHNNMKLLHGDIKSHNVLVKGDFDQVKLCDFGVTVRLNDSLDGPRSPDQCYVGTESWSPAEALEEGGLITDRADIYAYGCMLYEMLTLNIPHMPPLLEDSDEEDSFAEAEHSLLLGSRPLLPEGIQYDSSYKELLELFYVCTDEIASNRPSAKMIVGFLETLKENF